MFKYTTILDTTISFSHCRLLKKNEYWLFLEYGCHSDNCIYKSKSLYPMYERYCQQTWKTKTLIFLIRIWLSASRLRLRYGGFHYIGGHLLSTEMSSKLQHGKQRTATVFKEEAITVRATLDLCTNVLSTETE